MAGYTVVFSSIYDGTLYGRWPAAAVFASLLPLADKNGEIDMSIPAIAGRTGWPIPLLEEGIRQLSEPDPGSRSENEDGRRLMLLSDTRPWGWKLVNHGQYRERARLMAKDADRTASGRDAERKRQERAAESPDVPPCPPCPRVKSPSLPLSDSDSDSDSDVRTKKRKTRRDPTGPDATRERAVLVEPPEEVSREALTRWLDYRRGIGKPIKPPSMAALQRKFVALGDYAAQLAAVENSVGNQYQGLFAPTGAPNGRRIGNYERIQANLDRLIAEGEADENRSLLAGHDPDVRGEVDESIRRDPFRDLDVGD